MVVFDARGGRVASFNREAQRIVGNLRMPGRSVEDLLQLLRVRRADGAEIALEGFGLAQMLSEATTIRAEEIVLEVPDGRRITALVNATAIRAEDGAVESLVVTLQDLTPREELERLRAEFLGMVSHELQAPLVSIKGCAATALGDPAALDPSQARLFFRIVDEQADHMRALIGDLLDAARIETGTLSVAPEPTDVAAMVERARTAFLSGSRRNPVRIDLPPDLPRVLADRQRIVQVLGNLLINAARHSPESSVIRVAAARQGEHVAVAVADEGRFPTTATSDFLGSVRCTVLGSRRFTAIAVEMDAAQRIFNTLSVVPVDRTVGRGGETVLDFAHFVNGIWITDLVFVNLETQPSRPAPSPFHTAIPPSRPAIYFYDTAGNPIAAESVVDITGDLEITEDGALTVQTEMDPLGILTISTHGRGQLVTGSARVVSEGPIGGMLRFEHPDFGVAGVGASQPVSDALFPVRRQEGGITTGVALHNLESSPGLLRCDLMREGVLHDAASIPLEANGQTSWLIDQAFPAADTSAFAGSVRCDAVGEGLFSAVVLEMDPGNRIFATLPMVPVPEMPDRE